MGKFVAERDEMLLKRDINALRSFVKEHKDLYPAAFVRAFCKASDKVVEITLHKIIVNVTSLPFDFRQESADWLLDRGYSLDVV